jgi:NADP-dependent 3-hydroxy acid dehydrogenase YdfG
MSEQPLPDGPTRTGQAKPKTMIVTGASRGIGAGVTKVDLEVIFEVSG